VSLDSIVYLADRTNNRVQSFSADGTFLKEVFIDRHSRGFGSAFDVALSSDPEQRFLYVADGMNSRVVVVRRDTMEVVSRFGHGGPYPGGMYAVHSLATDSQGNLYTGETLHGRRVQRWIYKGLGPMGDTGE
jgi:DNA-binding beta-propeller fold protein YncE